MIPSAVAQKRTAPRREGDAVFSDSFYRPYAMAAQTAFLLLCTLRDNLRAAGEDPGVQALTFRLKSPGSIAEKLRRKGLPVTPAAAGSALHDIAGLRVVLGDIQEVYRFARQLCESPVVELCGQRDYIENPKRSGYRSLHLILRVPVSLGREQLLVPVEVQLRTQAMDIWASIEHDIVYKPAMPAD